MKSTMKLAACAFILASFAGACSPTEKGPTTPTDKQSASPTPSTEPTKAAEVIEYSDKAVPLNAWSVSTDGTKSEVTAESEFVSITFPLSETGEATGYGLFRMPTTPGQTYVWTGEIRSGDSSTGTTSVATYDGTFNRVPLEVTSDWQTFSIEITTTAETTNFYIDNRIEGASLKSFDTRNNTISSK